MPTPAARPSLTTITNGRLTVRVDALGAQLMNLTCSGVEYLWQGDERWWPRRAPVLFPIVGSLREGTTSANGPCPMGRHGIARSHMHDLVHASEDTLTYELRSSQETRAAFPFDFALRMTYAITGDQTLEQRFEVLNTGTATLPFTLGGHPAFNVPLASAAQREDADGEAFEDYQLEFARPWRASSPTMVDGGLWDFGRRIPVVDGSALRLSRRLFDTDTLLLENVPDSTVTLRGDKSGRGVRLDFAGFPYLGIWSARGDAPFVAIEPWTGCSTALDEDDVFEHKRGTRLLEPGEEATRSFTITVL